MSGETSHPEYISSYRLLSRLGESGAVHRAAGPDGRDVAVRLLPGGAAPDIARMRDVLSPYVVDVLDGDAAGATPFVVSRYVPGRPLAKTLAEQGPMPPAALRRLAFGLAKALAAIHEAGLAHGRLGPGTTLIVDDAPVVVDFGLAAGTQAADDVLAWAATVASAAAGTDAPTLDALALDALPAELRPLVAAAADPDAARRPDAAGLAEAASRLDLPPAPSPPVPPQPGGPPPVPPSPDAAGRAPVGGPVVRAHGLRVALGWARLLAAMVVVIAVALVVIAPVVGLVLTLGAVTLLRAADAREGDRARGLARAFGRTLASVPYAAVFTVAVPLGLVAVSAVGGEIDSLHAAAFGAGAGAAALWTAPGVSAPRRRLERTFLPAVRRPLRIAAASAVLGGAALLAVLGALTLTPTFSPMYGLQSSVEGTMDRLQTAVNRF
ncbi:hypothetical protein [Actinomadura sp. 7K507]|uniref:hypothetical protein n=1 Tax=Actinomadura sp. 7K507 TaxID=2530365 RepID=UPI001045C8C5|nr:hypothetical protein [Actinomadura sp. 7K507]TDC87576.1 hypothetical protein E1285_20245 [Actinomadura sp. 7K507]